MKKQVLESYLCFAALVVFTNSAVAGPGISGGGDDCENRIKVISLDIREWISSGGATDLKLPSTVSLERYNSSMSKELSRTSIKCVGEGDQGFPVKIGGTPKICRFDQLGEAVTITCDRAKFKSLSEEEQYVLVHHEYAGIAGIEQPRGADSNYEVSNQISAYLEETVIKKLAVKALGQPTEFLCESTIRKFIEVEFPSEEMNLLQSVMIHKSDYWGATGEVDIEVHALFDEEGYLARRIFISARGLLDSAYRPIGCDQLEVKASYLDPLAE